jgi:hypothetical protein
MKETAMTATDPHLEVHGLGRVKQKLKIVKSWPNLEFEFASAVGLRLGN